MQKNNEAPPQRPARLRQLRFLLAQWPCWACLVLLLLWAGSALAQQPVLLEEPPNEGPAALQNLPQQKTALDLDTIALPIVEDFYRSAYSFEPDTLFWYEAEAVRLSRGSSIGMPDMGTLLLDGSNNLRKPYNENGGVARADSIVTHCIDLSGLSPQDSVYLSFFYQAGGRNEAPELDDSLLVFFAAVPDTGGSFALFEKVWGTTGELPAQNWHQVLIPLNRENYFHECFQLKIQRRGSLSGLFDVWHVDHLRLAANRSAADSSYPDVGISEVSNRPLDSIFALPASAWQGLSGTPNASVDVVLRNFDLQNAANRTLSLSLVDSASGQVLLTENQNITIAPASADTLNFLNLDLQGLVPPAVLQLQLALNADPADTHLANDSLVVPFEVQNRYRLDDGEMERGYGLPAAQRGFGQRFAFQPGDSIQAVWMSFFPARPEPSSFRLAIWTDEYNEPDSVAFQSFKTPLFGDTRTLYFRYEMDSLFAATPNCWIGLIQQTDAPIGLGFDKNWNNASRIRFDDNGNWEQNTLDGTLMIWPVLKEGELVSRPEALPHPPAYAWQLKLYPNPAPARQARVSIELNGVPKNQSAHLRLLNLQGQTLLSQAVQLSVEGSKSKASVTLPAELAPGRYLVLLDCISTGGKAIRVARPMVLR